MDGRDKICVFFQLRARLVFGNSSKFDLDINLYGVSLINLNTGPHLFLNVMPYVDHNMFSIQVIDPEKSSVTYAATKVEIKLRKKHASNWPRLELKS